MSAPARTTQLDRAVVTPFGATIDRLTIPGWMVQSLAPDATETAVIRQSSAEETVFETGGLTFRYSRYGLERADDG